MKFGVFMAPFHRVGENPTLALERDLELLQWLAESQLRNEWACCSHERRRSARGKSRPEPPP